MLLGIGGVGVNKYHELGEAGYRSPSGEIKGEISL